MWTRDTVAQMWASQFPASQERKSHPIECTTSWVSCWSCLNFLALKSGRPTGATIPGLAGRACRLNFLPLTSGRPTVQCPKCGGNAEVVESQFPASQERKSHGDNHCRQGDFSIVSFQFP